MLILTATSLDDLEHNENRAYHFIGHDATVVMLNSNSSDTVVHEFDALKESKNVKQWAYTWEEVTNSHYLI